MKDQYEYNLLVTRSKSNQRIHTDKEKSQVLQRTNYLTKYISCGKHKNAYNSCDDCIVFPVKDKLPNERLPNGKQLLVYLAHKIIDSSRLKICTADIMNHLITCNIYRATHKSVSQKLGKMANNIYYLEKTSSQEQRGIILKSPETFCKGM